MEAPLALYRRYRPETFAEVIGQDHVTDPLRNALTNNRVNHAYLFSGPRGCGKTTSARILARAINCEQGPIAEPCGQCQSCRDLARGGPGSIDVIEIDAASHGGVDDARDLRERAFFAPVQSRYKIYIIDEAHMVTTQGFNALLKLVEEPPPHLKFIFATTEPDKVIGTIRSRTHHYPFRLVPPKVLADYMAQLCGQEKVSIEPAALPLVVRAGAGSVRDSLSVLDQLIGGAGPEGVTYQLAVNLLGFTPDSLLDACVDGFAAHDSAAVFEVIDKVIETGQDPKRFAEDLLRRLRDLVILSAVPTAVASGLIDVAEDQGERLQTQAAGIGAAELTRAADIVAAGLLEMRGATAPRLQLELICAKVLLPGADDSTNGIQARLDRIERRISLGLPVEPSASGVAASVPDDSLDQASARAAARSAVRGGPSSSTAAPSSAGTSYSGDAAPGGASAPGDAAASSGTPSSGAPSGGTPSGGTPASGGASTGGSVAPAASAPGAGGSGAWPEESLAAPAAQSVPPAQSAPAEQSAPAAQPSQPAQAQPASAGSSASGTGLGLADVRRVWPDILQRVKERKKVSWMIISQNAQVIAIDDKTLTIGLTHAGVRENFLRSGHDEILREAVRDTIMLDRRIEAVIDPSTDPSSGASSSGGSARSGGASQSTGNAPASTPPTGNPAGGGSAAGSSGGASFGDSSPTGNAPPAGDASTQGTTNSAGPANSASNPGPAVGANSAAASAIGGGSAGADASSVAASVSGPGSPAPAGTSQSTSGAQSRPAASARSGGSANSGATAQPSASVPVRTTGAWDDEPPPPYDEPEPEDPGAYGFAEQGTGSARPTATSAQPETSGGGVGTLTAPAEAGAGTFTPEDVQQGQSAVPPADAKQTDAKQTDGSVNPRRAAEAAYAAEQAKRAKAAPVVVEKSLSPEEEADVVGEDDPVLEEDSRSTTDLLREALGAQIIDEQPN